MGCGASKQHGKRKRKKGKGIKGLVRRKKGKRHDVEHCRDAKHHDEFCTNERKKGEHTPHKPEKHQQPLAMPVGATTGERHTEQS